MKLLINYFTSKWSCHRLLVLQLRLGTALPFQSFSGWFEKRIVIWSLWKYLNCLIMAMMLIIFFSRKNSSYDWAFTKCYFKHFTCMNLLIFLKNSFGGTYDISSRLTDEETEVLLPHLKKRQKDYMRSQWNKKCSTIMNIQHRLIFDKHNEDAFKIFTI